MKNVVKNTFLLYLVQFSIIIIPLLSIPYLSRVLLPDVFGKYMYAYSIAFWAGLMLEYGFPLSGIRKIAENQNDISELTRVVNDIQSAKIIILFALAVTCLILCFNIEVLTKSGDWLIATISLAVVLGFRPTWYFQGIEKMSVSALIDLVSGISSLLLMFFLIKEPEDGVFVLVIQAVSRGIAYGIGSAVMYRQIHYCKISMQGGIRALKEGLSMFIFTASVSMYTTANGIILGFIAPSSNVGAYLSAEKISKASLGLIGPVSQAVFPRITALAKENPRKARRLLLMLTAIMGIGGFIGSIILFFSSELIIKIVLGNGYDHVTPILKILSLLIPLIALSNVFGVHYLLPKRKDKIFNKIIITAGMLNILLAIFLAPQYEAIGMAWAIIISEFYVTLLMIIFGIKNQFNY